MKDLTCQLTKAKVYFLFQFSSVAQSCLTICDPMDYSMPGLLVPHHVLKFAQVHVHWTDTMLFNHLILCHPLLLLPSIFPSIRVFPSESALLIRWSKYRSFSFSIFSSLAFSTNQQMLVPLPFLYILKFSIQVLLKPTLKDFEHNLTRMGSKHNWLVVWTFFRTSLFLELGWKLTSSRGWDRWIASLIQWTWTWVNSRRRWGTGRAGVIQSMGSQRVGPDSS